MKVLASSLVVSVLVGLLSTFQPASAPELNLMTHRSSAGQPLSNRHIVERIITHDSLRSLTLRSCEATSAVLQIEDKCTLKVGNTNFIKKRAFFFDKKGTLIAVRDYKPMGPLTYTKEYLNGDTALATVLGVSELKAAKFSPNRSWILDGLDTLVIKEVWTKEKLVLISQRNDGGAASRPGLSLFYRYED